MIVTQMVQLGLDVFYQNPSVFFVISSSMIILIFALLLSNGLQRRETRIMIIVLPIAVATYLLSIQLDGTEHDFFQNLSTEFIGSLLALILFAEWITSNEYTFPLIAVTIFGMAAIFVWQKTMTGDDFYINLSTELLGALITTAVVRRDWLWSKADIIEESREERHLRFQNRRKKLEQETARQFCDVHLTLNGDTPESIEHQRTLLSETIELVYTSDIIQTHGKYKQIVYGNCHPLTLYPVESDSLMVILDGDEKAIQKTSQRLNETFDVQQTDDRIQPLGSRRNQLRLQIKTPPQSFAQEMRQLITLFITRWQDSRQTINPTSEEFAEGYHQAIEYVCQDIRTTIDPV